VSTITFEPQSQPSSQPQAQRNSTHTYRLQIFKERLRRSSLATAFVIHETRKRPDPLSCRIVTEGSCEEAQLQRSEIIRLGMTFHKGDLAFFLTATGTAQGGW